MSNHIKNNKNYRENNRISNLYILIPKSLKKKFKETCLDNDTNPSEVVRTYIKKYISRTSS